MKNTDKPADWGGDRTRAAVLRWAAALPADRYLVAAIPAGANGPTHRRLLGPGEFDRALGWLRWLNTCGHHIVGRPWDPRHVLIDDLSQAAVEVVTARHRPAAIVESSPGNFQVWLTLAEGSVLPAAAGAAARLLAARYGGDRGAASASQPGRLPGLTNRKPRHCLPTGLYPFALLRQAAGPQVDPVGAEILAKALQCPASAAHAPRSPDSAASSEKPRRRLIRRAPAEEHAAAMARIVVVLPPGMALDRSRADHAAARRLLARGMSVAEAIGVMLAGERARSMPTAAAEAYAQRTVEAAKASLGRLPAPWC
ncbi:DNA-primase RepB domain-containing protein [Belnapia rosea]|uniref:DNA-primase RepB domain-containing protein n=1 Tax=Belnapia rosea TaxID=938405 RepID=UPI00088D41BF|nr:DNA-primase RepB domain-containing protein [Belnapia rosea]SDB74291.1 RepB DNA-primase [Belnapia rosea]